MTKLEITISADDELLAALSNLIAALNGKKEQSEPAPVLTVEPMAPKEERLVTLQQVRELLADKSQSGKQAEVKALITKYGAVKLTDIDPAQYSNLLKDAEGL